MAAKSKPWEQVGETFESLGAHLRSRFDGVGADAAADRAAFEKSVRSLLSAVEDVLGAAGKAVNDPTLRQDLTDLATSLRAALVSTFGSAGEQVRDVLAAPVRRGKSVVGGKSATAHKPAGKTAAHKKGAS